jgi:hypothetical protein
MKTAYIDKLNRTLFVASPNGGTKFCTVTNNVHTGGLLRIPSDHLPVCTTEDAAQVHLEEYAKQYNFAAV